MKTLSCCDAVLRKSVFPGCLDFLCVYGFQTCRASAFPLVRLLARKISFPLLHTKYSSHWKVRLDQERLLDTHHLVWRVPESQLGRDFQNKRWSVPLFPTSFTKPRWFGLGPRTCVVFLRLVERPGMLQKLSKPAPDCWAQDKAMGSSPRGLSILKEVTCVSECSHPVLSWARAQAQWQVC